jgi:hypothetical protein
MSTPVRTAIQRKERGDVLGIVAITVWMPETKDEDGATDPRKLTLSIRSPWQALTDAITFVTRAPGVIRGLAAVNKKSVRVHHLVGGNVSQLTPGTEDCEETAVKDIDGWDETTLATGKAKVNLIVTYPGDPAATPAAIGKALEKLLKLDIAWAKEKAKEIREAKARETPQPQRPMRKLEDLLSPTEERVSSPAAFNFGGATGSMGRAMGTPTRIPMHPEVLVWASPPCDTFSNAAHKRHPQAPKPTTLEAAGSPKRARDGTPLASTDPPGGRRKQEHDGMEVGDC